MTLKYTSTEKSPPRSLGNLCNIGDKTYIAQLMMMMMMVVVVVVVVVVVEVEVKVEARSYSLSDRSR